VSISNEESISHNNSGQREAVILFADLMNSSELANNWSLHSYDEFVTVFQKELGEVVKQYIQSKADYKSKVCPFLEAEIRGDEICLILYRASDKQSWLLHEDVEIALQIAIKMKRKWLLCPLNQERIREGRSIFDIGIGIHQGPILLGKHHRFLFQEDDTSKKNRDLSVVEKITPEGHSINLAKRIETHSRELHFSQILISHNVFNLVDPDFRIAFRRSEIGPFKGISQTIPVYEAIGIGHFDDQAFEPGFKDNELEIYELAVTNNPDMVWLLLDLGHYYFDVENYERSAEMYQQVINIIPDFAPAHMYLGRCWFRSYRNEEAVCSLECALQLNKLSPRANNFLAVCLRRLAYKYRFEKGEGWKELYRKALELQDRARRITTPENPAHLWALNGLSRTIAEADNESRSHFSLEDAEEFAKNALALIREYRKKTRERGGEIDKEHLVLETLGYIYLKRLEEKDYRGYGLNELFNKSEQYFIEAKNTLERRNKNEKEKMGNKSYHEKLSEIYFHVALLNKVSGKVEDAKEKATKAIQAASDVDEKFPTNQYWYKEAEDMLRPVNK
jgi:class 3 adenylate cyclase/tetratricopeptide (TPR) repeat protein